MKSLALPCHLLKINKKPSLPKEKQNKESKIVLQKMNNILQTSKSGPALTFHLSLYYTLHLYHAVIFFKEEEVTSLL